MFNDGQLLLKTFRGNFPSRELYYNGLDNLVGHYTIDDTNPQSLAVVSPKTINLPFVKTNESGQKLLIVGNLSQPLEFEEFESVSGLWYEGLDRSGLVAEIDYVDSGL